MKLPFHLLCVVAASSLAGQQAVAQSVGIGTPTPDAKSALEIKATDKGLLIPRLTAAQRTAIASPPQGLMVYQTDGTAAGGAQTGFWYYAGAGGWVFIEPGAAVLPLPYAGTASTSGPAFAIGNTGAGLALSGTTGAAAAAAVHGDNTNAISGLGVGVLGTTVSGYGVRGTASGSSGYGVAGSATDSRGVSGSSVSGPALYGRSTSGVSVQAQKAGADLGRVAELTNTNAANDSTALYISTPGDRPALRAVNTATSAQAAIRGVKQSASTDGIGVEGVITNGASGNAAGVRGLDQSGSGGGSGVLGLTASGYGVRGVASGNGGYGVSGQATTSYGVIGSSTSGAGVYGSSASSYGVQGNSTSGVGVYGTTTVSGSGLAGVVGINSNSSGVGVLGRTTNGSGVRGEATGSNGYGMLGTAVGTNGIAVYGSANGGATAIYGVASGTGRAGYFNQNSTTGTANVLEVQNSSLGRTAFFNQSNSSNTANAVEVQNDGTGRAALFVGGSQNTSPAVEITNPNFGTSLAITGNSPTIEMGVATLQSYAGFGGNGFILSTTPLTGGATIPRITLANPLSGPSINSLNGNWAVTGNLSKAGGSFKIDHPLDPENQYLYHSFVESPDMLNVYNGNVVLDAKGEAEVQLPDWFEALNRDFRYQLTPIGAAFTPYVLAEVAGNKFRVAGQPGGKVSWLVTGIRHDKWANQNRIPVTEQKEPENRGKFLAPAAYGQPASRGIGYRAEPTKAAARR